MKISAIALVLRNRVMTDILNTHVFGIHLKKVNILCHTGHGQWPWTYKYTSQKRKINKLVGWLVWV